MKNFYRTNELQIFQNYEFDDARKRQDGNKSKKLIEIANELVPWFLASGWSSLLAFLRPYNLKVHYTLINSRWRPNVRVICTRVCMCACVRVYVGFKKGKKIGKEPENFVWMWRRELGTTERRQLRRYTSFVR